MQGLGLRGKSAAHFLDGPRFFAARGLPEQLSGFLEACAALGLAGWIAGLAGPPSRGFIAGNARLELRILLHICRLLTGCSSMLMDGKGVNRAWLGPAPVATIGVIIE